MIYFIHVFSVPLIGFRPFVQVFLEHSDKRKLLENFFSLSVLQGVTYILPLITVPYLVRVLGAERFGLIAFSQALIQYFMILTDYGFNLSATREVSLHRTDRVKLSEIFNSVMMVRFVLMAVSLAVLAAVVFSFGKFRQEWLLYFLTFGMVFGSVLFPIWFFQGVEEMRYITILNIVAKTLFTVAIFVFIRKSSDYIYVPLFNSLGFITAGALSLWIIFRRFQMPFFVPSRSAAVAAFKDSTPFFLSRVSVSLYTSSNAFVLGLFTTNQIVGYYAAAEKIYNALQYLYQPINSVLYPYMSKARNIILYRKIFFGANACNGLLSLLVLIFAERLCVVLFGSEMQASAGVLRIFAIVTFVVIPSVLLGYPLLAAMGYAKYANGSVIFGSIVHFVGLVVLMALSSITMYTVTVMVLITETIVFAVRAYGAKKEHLWRVA